MIGPSDLGRELDSLATVLRDSRKKLNDEKDALCNQVKDGGINTQEGLLRLVEMNTSHSNDIMLPVAQAALRAAQFQCSSAVQLTNSVNLARKLEKLTWALIALTAVLAVGAAGDLITAAKTMLYVPPPPIVKFVPPSPTLFGR
jgi:hypothetical protein